jgi:hypothetical protein
MKRWGFLSFLFAAFFLLSWVTRHDFHGAKHLRFVADFESSASGLSRVFFDVGSGFNGSNSSAVAVQRGSPKKHIFPLFPKKQAVRSIRFDPINTGAVIRIKSAWVENAHGDIVKKFLPRDFKPIQHVDKMEIIDGALIIHVSKNAPDPMLLIENSQIKNSLGIGDYLFGRGWIIIGNGLLVFICLACLSCFAILLASNKYFVGMTRHLEASLSRPEMKSIASNIVNPLILGLLFLAVFQFPEFTASSGHDAGSQAAYEYWFAHGFSWGTDIIQNTGPLGFLNYPGIYTGFVDTLKLFLSFFLTGVFIFLFWRSLKEIPFVFSAILFIFAVFFAFGDCMIYLLLLLLFYLLMSTSSILVSLLALLLLAMLALAKGTCFFIALFVVVASVANSILSRRFVFAVSIASGFIIFLLALWVLAGQPLFNFPEFARAITSFSSGYSEAMTIFEPGKVRGAGFIALSGGLLLILLKMICALRHVYADVTEMCRQILLASVEFFIFFVVWKHGFVRADGHTAIFFQYVLVSYLLVLFRKEKLYGVQGNGSRALAGVLLLICFFVTIACLVGINAMYPLNPVATYRKMVRTGLCFVDIPKRFRALEEDLKKNVAAMQIARIRALVKKKSIGYFGIYPGVILYNQLNYIPNPASISFASWNASIMAAEESFFKDDNRAPCYLLYDLQTIDNRLPAQDDSLAKLVILNRYEPVGAEAGNILFRRNNRRRPVSRSVLSERNYNVGEWIAVPPTLSPVWVKVRVKETFLTRVVSLVYKPPQYSLEVLFKNGGNLTYKLIPRMAETGFMINPLISDNLQTLIVFFQQEYQKYLNDTHENLSKVVKFRLICEKQKIFGGRRAIVTFEEIHGLPFGEGVDINKLYAFNSQMFDFQADIVGFKVPSPIEMRTAFGSAFYQFHAPSRITLHKSGGTQKLQAFYGLHPSAYEQGGATDGVALSVRLVTLQGKNLLVFSKDLNPIEVPYDRGEQFLNVDLPIEEGNVVIEVNPKKSSDYDQFLVRKIVVQKMAA